MMGILIGLMDTSGVRIGAHESLSMRIVCHYDSYFDDLVEVYRSSINVESPVKLSRSPFSLNQSL